MRHVRELSIHVRGNGFTVLLTTDKNLACEQAPLSIALITILRLRGYH